MHASQHQFNATHDPHAFTNVFTFPTTNILSQRYFSDTSDNRHVNDPMSLSPTPLNQASNHTASTVTEVDGGSPNANDANRRVNPPRIMQPKLSPNANRRLFIHDNYARSPTTSIDARLNDWLVKNNIDPISRNIVLSELFTYEDFVYELEKSDLHRIGLK